MQDHDILPLLPLKPAVVLILVSLAEGEKHGYAVMKSIRERSEGRIKLETGPLYRHLSRLIEDGLVEETEREAEADDPRRRCYYRLSRLGRRVLAAEARALADVVNQMRRLGVLRKGN